MASLVAFMATIVALFTTLDERLYLRAYARSIGRRGGILVWRYTVRRLVAALRRWAMTRR